MRCLFLAFASCLILIAPDSFAGEADVLAARAVQARDGSWTLSARLRHDDEGWNHYADRWEALTPDGTVIAVRELAHPHVNEQPFTRSLARVEIDPAVPTLLFRARDTVHGYGGRDVTIALTRRR